MENQVYDPLDVHAPSTERGLGVLREFDAILANAKHEKKQSTKSVDNEGKPRTYVMIGFEFTDMVVIDSVEPYILPTYLLETIYTEGKGEKWDVLKTSIANVIDKAYSPAQLNPKDPAYVEPRKREGLAQQYGKRFHMVMCDGEKGRPAKVSMYSSKDKKAVPTSVWICTGIGGGRPANATVAPAGAIQSAAAPSPAAAPAPAPAAVAPKALNALQQAMVLLDGKDASSFNLAAMQDAIVLKDGNVLNAINAPADAPTSFLKTMTNAGLFTVDQAGVYHRVQAK